MKNYFYSFFSSCFFFHVESPSSRLYQQLQDTLYTTSTFELSHTSILFALRRERIPEASKLNNGDYQGLERVGI